jgi:hypothetical protein
MWDVHITESSSLGTAKYTVTLDIDGTKGSYVDSTSDSHYQGGSWNELKFGHTPSGKTFVAEHRIRHPPSFLGRGAAVNGPEGLRGRMEGPNSAKFCTSMTVSDSRGDQELEIHQEGVMRRRA